MLRSLVHVFEHSILSCCLCYIITFDLYDANDVMVANKSGLWYDLDCNKIRDSFLGLLTS